MKGRQFCSFMFCKIGNTASFDSFTCIKIITLKLNFYNHKILVSTQILIKHPIMLMKCRALLLDTPTKKETHLSRRTPFCYLIPVLLLQPRFLFHHPPPSITALRLCVACSTGFLTSERTNSKLPFLKQSKRGMGSEWKNDREVLSHI